jgi:hypothetical protein
MWIRIGIKMESLRQDPERQEKTFTDPQQRHFSRLLFLHNTKILSHLFFLGKQCTVQYIVQ